MADDTGLVTGGPGVVLEGVNPKLIGWAQHAALIHKTLFGIDMVITSGRDSQHVAGSLHAEGLALDIRTHDLSADAQLLWLLILCYAGEPNDVCVFDERALPGAPHIHVEYHGA